MMIGMSEPFSIILEDHADILVAEASPGHLPLLLWIRINTLREDTAADAHGRFKVAETFGAIH